MGIVNARQKLEVKRIGREKIRKLIRRWHVVTAKLRQADIG